MMLYQVTLQLARTPEFPHGSNAHGYEITAPLDSEGHLDTEAWRTDRDRCRVRRFLPEQPDRFGWLVHRAGGAGGATWIIDYDKATEEDDEAGYRLDTHRFVAGEYASIRDEEGDLHPYRVTSVIPLGS